MCNNFGAFKRADLAQQGVRRELTGRAFRGMRETQFLPRGDDPVSTFLRSGVSEFELFNRELFVHPVSVLRKTGGSLRQQTRPRTEVLVAFGVFVPEETQ